MYKIEKITRTGTTIEKTFNTLVQARGFLLEKCDKIVEEIKTLFDKTGNKPCDYSHSDVKNIIRKDGTVLDGSYIGYEISWEEEEGKMWNWKRVKLFQRQLQYNSNMGDEEFWLVIKEEENE